MPTKRLRMKQEGGLAISSFIFTEKVNIREYKQEFHSYVGFLYWANELNELETEAFHRVEPWLREVESTGMLKSYKMIVLLFMLERGSEHWLDPVNSTEVALFFHTYLTEKEYRKRIDFSRWGFT
jgi:hypothetical protein